MSQTRINEFGQVFTSDTMNLLFKAFELPGVYFGFDVFLVSPDQIRLTAGTLLLPDGVVVVESQDRILAAVSNTAERYGLYITHQRVAVIGGVAADYQILPVADEGDLSEFSFLRLAEFTIEPTGIVGSSILVSAKIQTLLQTILQKSLVGALSSAVVVPFTGHLVTVGALPVPAIEAKKHYYPNVDASLSVQIHVPLGLTPTGVLVNARQAPGEAAGLLSVSVFDTASAAVTLSQNSVPTEGFATFTFIPFLFSGTPTFAPQSNFTVEMVLERVDLHSLVVTFGPSTSLAIGNVGTTICP